MPPRSKSLVCACLALVLAAGAGCNRRIEPFDPDEKVEAPDLSRIFPEGAERPEAAEGAGTGAPAAAGADGAPIRGTVELAPELAASVPRGAVLFLVARGAQPGPPVAVKRISGPSFPLAFELGPDDRMIQSIPFAGPLQISARVDTDGNASSRQPGDLQGESAGPVQPGDSGVVVRIDTRVSDASGAAPLAGPAMGGRGAPAAAAGAGAPIRGTLVLAPELAGSVPAGAVLFLVARGQQPGPPVAVKRISGPSFPMPFELGPDDRMIQSIPFAGPLQISARVDADGNATSRQPGDLQGESEGSVQPGDDDVTIRIDTRL